jgi:hypothetical protein
VRRLNHRRAPRAAHPHPVIASTLAATEVT